MKEYYRIKEISQLYGIGTDSLRYYEELGILKPKRASNGYRLYGMGDIYNLNIVKDLRQAGFSMKQIKAYLDSKSVANTHQLLSEAHALLRAEIERLCEAERSLARRIAQLQAFETIEAGRIEMLELPARPVVSMHVDIRRDEEVDFALNKLNRRFGHKIYAMGDYLIGATMEPDEIRSGSAWSFHSVFFILDEGEAACDFLIPAGRYLSLHYRGGYEQGEAHVRTLMAFADEQGERIVGSILELYKIDIHETNDRNEFLTEIQFRVERRTADNYNENK